MCITLRAHNNEPNTSLVYSKKYLFLGAEYFTGLGFFNIEKCYVYNIFTIPSQQIISRKVSFFSLVTTNNNLPFKICCKNIVISLRFFFFFFGVLSFQTWCEIESMATPTTQQDGHYLFIYLSRNQWDSFRELSKSGD